MVATMDGAPRGIKRSEGRGSAGQGVDANDRQPKAFGRTEGIGDLGCAFSVQRTGDLFSGQNIQLDGGSYGRR